MSQVRDRRAWLRPLEAKVAKEEAASLKLSPAEVRRIAFVELGLEFLASAAPNSAVKALPGYLSGYPIKSQERVTWTAEEERLAANATFILRNFTRSFSWRQECAWYRQLPANLRLFEIPSDDQPVVRKPCALLVVRQVCYDDALRGSIPRRSRRLPLATPGQYSYEDRDRVERPITISPDIVEGLELSRTQTTDETLSWVTGRNQNRQPWVVTAADKAKALEVLKRMQPNGNWEKRSASMTLEDFLNRDELVISGFSHGPGW